MNDSTAAIPYTVLQARGTGARADEVLNVGVVLHAPGAPLVAVSQDTQRLRALHPDYSVVDLASWAKAVEAALREHAFTLSSAEQQHALLPLLVPPFQTAEGIGMAAAQGAPEATLQGLMNWLVHAPQRTLKAQPRSVLKRPTRLSHELRAWFRSAKVFSTKVDDLSKGKIVANYPIDPGADLYADFAVLNGKLNAIETLDLRGVGKLTSSLRGDAALKGITLDEARQHLDGKRIVVFSASDYAVARPAIQLISRYADDVLDMHEAKARQQLAEFLAGALHRTELPALELHD